MKPPVAAWLVGFLAIVAFAGTASAAVVEVHIHNAAFVPNNVTVALGDSVVFFNDDSIDHDVTFEAGFGSGAAGSLTAGTNWSHIFATAGAFKFRCQLHSGNFDSGMVGVVVVGTAPPPPPTPSGGFLPGFELLGAVAAVGLVAALGSRRRAR